MEYASGGELFERICNAGRFSEDEVLIYSFHAFLLQFCCSYCLPLMPIMFCCRHASSSNNLYQGLATVMQWYISSASLVFTFTIGIMSCWLQCFYLSYLIKQVCHRDLKLENTLLDGSPAPRLKICDFGYSKVYFFLHTVLSVSTFRLILPAFQIVEITFELGIV